MINASIRAALMSQTFIINEELTDKAKDHIVKMGLQYEKIETGYKVFWD